jgi:hypothetical protein
MVRSSIAECTYKARLPHNPHPENQLFRVKQWEEVEELLVERGALDSGWRVYDYWINRVRVMYFVDRCCFHSCLRPRPESRSLTGIWKRPVTLLSISCLSNLRLQCVLYLLYYGRHDCILCASVVLGS